MGNKDYKNYTALHAEVSGDEERVQAVLASWGLEESLIQRLLTEKRAGQSPPKISKRREPDATVTLLHGGMLPRGYASH